MSGGGMTPTATKKVSPEPLIRVGDDFEDEYPGASSLATECYANLVRVADQLLELHRRASRDAHQLSQPALQVLAIVEGAGEPVSPSVIAERLLVTTGTMTSLLDTLERRGLVQRLPHPDDRRKVLVDLTPTGQAIVDQLLPSLHARERDVVSDALSANEQRQLVSLLAKVQQAAIRANSVPQPLNARRVRRRGAGA